MYAVDRFLSLLVQLPQFFKETLHTKPRYGSFSVKCLFGGFGGVFLCVDASKAMETNSVFLRQAASKKLVLC